MIIEDFHNEKTIIRLIVHETEENLLLDENNFRTKEDYIKFKEKLEYMLKNVEIQKIQNGIYIAIIDNELKNIATILQISQEELKTIINQALPENKNFEEWH